MAEGQGRSSGQGVKLLYIRDYLYAHATKEHPKNAKHIVDYLASKGISASVKTIYNDILRLQIDFGVPVEYNPQKWGYYITKPHFEPYELRLLVDSVQSAKFLTDKMAAQLSEKIKGLADVYTKDSLNRQAYVSNRVHNMNEAAMKGLDCIYEAISKNRKISCRYFKYAPNRTDIKQYTKYEGSIIITVSPYLVMWDGERHVLYAYVKRNGQDALTTMCAERMERVRVLEEPREGQTFMQEHGILKYKFTPFGLGVFTSGARMVRLLVHNDCAIDVVEKFGTDLIMVPYDEKHFTVTVEVELTPLFFTWVLLYPLKMRILSPEYAVEEMKALLKVLATWHEESPNQGLVDYLIAVQEEKARQRREYGYQKKV